jgi:hypothetical protein
MNGYVALAAGKVMRVFGVQKKQNHSHIFALEMLPNLGLLVTKRKWP